MSEIIRLFWRLRYAIYSRDLYGGLRAGRGSKDNPLSMKDLEPLMKALGRIGDDDWHESETSIPEKDMVAK